VGAVGLIIGAAIVLPEMQPGGSTGLRVAVILIASGALLLVRPQFRYPADAADGIEPAGGTEPRRARERRAPREERPPSSLGLLALSLLVVTVGVVAAVDQSGREVSLGVVSSVALVIVGAALTLSGWRGRARGLILLAPVLVAAWIAFAPGNVVLYPGSGARTHTIASAGEVAADYRLGFGSLTLDAAAARFEPGEPVELDVRQTAGRVRVDVPAGVRLRLVGRLGLGAYDVYDDRWGWPHELAGDAAVNRRLDREWAALGAACTRLEVPPWKVAAPPTYVDPFGERCVPQGPPDNPPEVTVNVTLGSGYLEVHRVPPPA
jgi:hypothetical protein